MTFGITKQEKKKDINTQKSETKNHKLGHVKKMADKKK